MNILLGVCGSISAYKSYDILRGFIKENCKVRIILTKGSLKFIKKETFYYLGAEKVYTYSDDFDISSQINNVLHIDLKDWSDKLIISPLSANTLSKIANGQCDDLLTSVFLSYTKKDVIVFPAMNTQMLENITTQRNIKLLSENPQCFIHPPSDGTLACGEIGKGKLPDVDTIVDFSIIFNNKIKNRTILITTGATIAPIDPVRFITNPSSGKTGFELAKSYLEEGCEVYLVYGMHSTFNKYSLLSHPRLHMIEVSTTEQMYQKVNKLFERADVFISSAAVSDFEFIQSDSKIKKDKTEKRLNFSWAKDILKEMIKKKTKKQKIISFAAETSNNEDIFQNKFQNKPVDLMVGNLVHNGFNGKPQGFGQNKNQYFFIKNGKVDKSETMTKNELSKIIKNFTENHNDKNN